MISTKYKDIKLCIQTQVQGISQELSNTKSRTRNFISVNEVKNKWKENVTNK